MYQRKMPLDMKLKSDTIMTVAKEGAVQMSIGMMGNLTNLYSKVIKTASTTTEMTSADMTGAEFHPLEGAWLHQDDQTKILA